MKGPRPPKSPGPSASRRLLLLAAVLIPSAALFLAAPASAPPAHADSHQLTAEISNGTDSPTALASVPFVMKFNKGVDHTTLSASDIVASSGTVQNLRVMPQFNAAFSGRGSGTDQIDRPRGVEADGTFGRIYVADTFNHRVQVFHSNGSHATSIVASSPSFNYPYGVEVDGSGSLYVADTSNGRVRIFDSDGSHVEDITGFNRPADVAVSGSGHIHVADRGTHVVSIFDSDWNHVTNITGFNRPSGVAVDGSGAIYVANTDNDTVATFNSARESTGLLPGTFRGPYGVAVDDTSGTIYVADSSNRRVKIFNSTQHHVADLPRTFQFPSDVDVDGATGKIYVVDGSVERIWIFDTAYAFDVADPAAGRLTVSLPAGRVQDAGGNANEASNTEVIVIERSPTATITTPAQPGPTNLAAVPFRLKFNEPIRPATLDASDISASSGTVQNLRVSPLHTHTIGAPGSGDGEFGDPRGVAVNGSGFIHVADQDNSRVQILRPDGTYNGSIAGFTRPTGVAVSDSGAVYVAYRDAGNVRKFNPDGSSAVIIRGLSQPSGVAVDGSGAVYVADTGADNVRKFHPNGSSADTIGGLSQPSGVAVDGSGAVYVADTGSDTVRIYSSALQSAANITGFSEPRGVAVDGSGAIYVADTGSDTVRIYSSALQSAANITGFGEPRGVAVDDSSGTLYVTSDNTVKALDLAYAFDVADPADGRLAVSLPAGRVEDTAGIGNEESNTAEIDVDRTAPMPATTSAQSSPTNARTINFTVAFSEPVTGFELAGIALSGTAAPGNATDFAGSGASYTFGASPSTDGTILVDVPAGGARDEAGNGNAPAERFSITYDETAPVPALAAEAPGPTNLTAVPFNLTFSEPANAIALAASDVVASSGTVQNLTSAWPPDATFGGRGSGPVQFDTPSGIAVDGSGNIYVADRENNRIQVLNSSKGYVAHIPWLDHPTGVTIDGPSGRIYVADFSADVVRIYDHRRTQVALLDDDFAQPSDVAVGGPSGRIHVVDFGNDRVRVYDSSLNRVGEITGFNKPFGVAVDASGIMYVTERDSNRVRIYHPNITLAGYITGLSSPYGVEVDAFGSIYVADYGSDRVRVYDSSRARVADITGLSGPYGVEVDGAAGALYVTERTAHRIRTFDAPHVEFNVADPADGQVLAVSLPAGLVHDLAGNENAASDAESIRADRTAPAPNITSALPGPTAAPTIPFAVDFGENVTGFEASDIELSGNASGVSVGNFSGSGDSYTFYVSPATNGTILVDVPANVTHDGAGNINTAADQFSITYNSAVSTPTVTATQQSPTNAATINFLVNFSKPVIGFTADGIELSGTAAHGGVANFAGSGDSYTFDVSPTADGTILVDVPAGAARIDAGINSTKSAQFPMTYDGTAPAPTITAAQRGPTNARTINFTVAFSEPVTGFELAGIALSGTAAPGNATDFSGSGASYAFGASPAADGTILVDVPAGGARDEAGNNNTAAERFSIRYDGTAPVPAFAAARPGPTNLTAVPFNLTFSEPVNASTLEASDINATSGTVRNLRDAWRPGATFGSGPGSGPGQFNEPSGIAVDASGTIYVADRTNNRVQVLDSAGGHVANIPGLAWPNGVAVNASGYLYVADTNAHAVRVYDTNRTKVADITDGFSQPTAVAVGGPSGHAYVVDYGNGRVRVYDSSLARVGEITGFSQPRGAAVNASGYLYVADTNAHAVRVYDPNGTKVADIADAADPFGQPYGVAVDASGYSYVADFDNNRVRVYDSSWDHSVDVAGLSGPHAAAVDPASGALYVTERPAHRIKAHDAARDFKFDVADPADGRLTVSLPAGLVHDLAGNENAASDAESIRTDRTAPAPNITSALPGPTAAPTIPFVIDFGENVTGFEAGDIELSGTATHGGVGNFSGSGDSYTFYVSPTADGTILVDVPANVTYDGAGNGNTAADQFSIIYNTTVPVPTIAATQQSPTNAATINFQVNFSVPVTEFEQGDIELSNDTKHGGAINFTSLNSTTYTFGVSPTADGTILVDVPAGAARDDAGNRNAPAKQFMVTYDGTAPAPTITATQQSPTGAATINFQVKFNENVTGFEAGDIELSNDTKHGGAINFTPLNSTTYAFGVSPTADGTILVDVPAGAARDDAGNNNTRAKQFSMIYDGTAPAPTITATQQSPTGAATINFQVKFNENVTGFEAGDIELSNDTKHGGAINFTPLNSTTYAFGVSPTADGTILVDVPADGAQDKAGNGNTAADQFSIIYDSSVPTPTVTATQQSPTNAATINFQVNFTAPVTGFEQGDIELSNDTEHGGVDDFAGSGDSYTFDVSPTADGTILVDVPAGAARSAATGISSGAARFLMTYDGTAPAPTITATQQSPTNAATINFQVKFEENVTGFEQGDIELSNDTAHGGVDDFVALNSTTYAFDVSPTTDGAILVDVPAGAARDAAGNNNTRAKQFLMIYDGTAPAPNITATQQSPTGAATINFRVNFTEPVTGFEAGDIELSNDTKHGGVGNFAALNSTTYAFGVSPTADGAILVDVPADGAQDKAGNGNTAADQFSITYDISVPTPTVTAAQQSPTNAATINFQVNFSVPVTGFEQGDIELSNDTEHGGVDDFAGSGDSYSFDVSPTADGTILVDVPAGAARSAATNIGSTKSAQFSMTYDGTAPAPTIAATQQSPTNAATINFQVKFEENVTGFEAGDIELSNDTAHGGVDDFAGGGDSYTFDVSPTTDGAILVDVPAGAARDDAGNNNTRAKQFSMIHDGTAPAPTITAAQQSPTGAATINFQVKFEENVTGFEPGDVDLSNDTEHGGVGNFAGGGSLYSFDVSPATDGTILVDVPANVAQDKAGNGNTAADQFSITYDSSVPTPTITAAQQNPTNATTINFQVNFTEPVTGFEAGDIELSNDTAHGGAANFAALNSTTYTFDVSPTADGTILVDVPAGAARSEATGIGSGAARFSITYEGAAPAAGVLLEAARLDLEAGSNGRLTVTFGGAVTMPDARSFAGEIVIRGGGGEVALSAADVPSVASGHPGDAAFALDISGAKRVQLNGADLGSATVSLPDGFVSDAGGSPYARGGLPPVPLAHAQDPSPPRLAAAAINLEPGSSSTGRLTVTFDEAVTMPDARSFAGEIEIRGRSGGGDATLALSAGDFESAASGSEGGRTFALPVPGPKAEALGAAEYSDPLYTTVSLPDGFVTNGRSAHEREPAPLSAGRDSDGPSFVWAFVLNGSSVAAVYDEPVLAVPAHYSNVRVDGAPAEGNRGAASGAAAFGNNVVVSWNAGIGTTASAGSEVRFDVSENVTDAFGNHIENPGPKSAGGQEGNKRSVLVGAFSRGPGDPSAGAARLGAAAFNALSEERGYAFLVNVTEYALPAGASGAAAGAALRDAHDGGRGPALYVGPASDAALRGMAGYAGANGITLVSHSSAARSLAVEGDGIYRLEPGAAHLARVLAVEIARGGFGAVVPVVQTDARGPEYGLLGPLASDLGPLGVRVGPPVEFSGGGGGAAAAPIGDAVREAAGSGTARSVAVVYAGSDSGLAAIAGGAGAGSPVRDRSAWFAAGGAGAGAGGGVAASPLVLRDAAAVQLARDVRLSAVQFAVERNAATDFVDYAAYGPAGAPGPAASATPAYAAYEAARILGRALALAGGDPSGAGAHVARAADSDGGPLGRTGVNGAGDLRLPITYGAWSVSDTAAEWERAPELLRGLDSCGIDLEKSALALPNLSAGSTSRPARQTVTNIGTGPMPAVSVSATDWAQFKDGVPVQGLLPFSYTEMAVGLDGASPRRADSTPLAAGTVIPGGTPPGGSVDVDFRINLGGLDALEADFISQTVTFVVNCS